VREEWWKGGEGEERGWSASREAATPRSGDTDLDN